MKAVGLNDINGVGFWEEGLGSERDSTFHPKPMHPPVLRNNQAYWKVESDWLDPEGNDMIAEGNRANWAAVEMPIQDRDDHAGMEMMDHTENPEFPVPWRVDVELGILPAGV